MEHLLPLLKDHTLPNKPLLSKLSRRIRHLLLRRHHAPLLNQPPCLAIGGRQPALHQQGQRADGPIGKVRVGQGGGRHIHRAPSGGEQGAGRRLGLVRLLLAVDEAGDLVGQYLLGTVQLAPLPGFHGLDLLNGQEGQEFQTLDDIGILHVAPILEEVVGGELTGIQPDGAAHGLAHLLPFLGSEQLEGHAADLLALHPAHQVHAAQDVAPLVVPAQLHGAVVELV